MAHSYTLAGIIVLVVLGAAAVFLLLPKAGRYSLRAGGFLGLLALLALGVYLGPAEPTPETLLFYLFSAIAIAAGCLLITQRNPARAALSFALVVISTCGLFLLQAAPFLMAATIIIYAGAIIVTFLFVLMLAQQEGPSDADNRTREPLLATLGGFALLATILYTLGDTYRPLAGQELDARLHDLDRAAARLPSEAGQPGRNDGQEILGELDRSLTEFQDWLDRQTRPGDLAEKPPVLPDESKTLEGALTDTRSVVGRQKNNLQNQKPVAWQELSEEVHRLQDAGKLVRNSFGILQPSKDRPLSSFSGPAANLPLADLRRDDEGRPQLPAENVAYLGRSLFTDYLLAVELGGTLLLVATIGAIAIASRRAERLP